MDTLPMRACVYLADAAGINVLKGDAIDSTDPATIAHLYVALHLGKPDAPTYEQVLDMDPVAVFETVSELVAPGKPEKKRARRPRKTGG
jgi:hypothetical protein